MAIKITKVSPRPTLGKALVTVTFSQKRGETWDIAEFQVFVEETDSFTDLRQKALQAASLLAQEIAETQLQENDGEGLTVPAKP